MVSAPHSLFKSISWKSNLLDILATDILFEMSFGWCNVFMLKGGTQRSAYNQVDAPAVPLIIHE